MSHNSLGTSYCQISAKRTAISRKMSTLIEGWKGADWEVPACFARGGTGRYGTLKVNVLYHTMPHKLCGCEVKDAHSIQSFVSTHSGESDSVLFILSFQ